MKFKIGDLVRIKKKSVLKRSFSYVNEMGCYAGKIAEIRWIDMDGSYKLRINGKDIPYWWYNGMLELINGETVKLVVYTDMKKTVVVKTDKGVGKAKLAEGDTFDLFEGIEIAYNRANRDTSRWVPRYGESYFTPQPDSKYLYTQEVWYERLYDNNLLNKGFVFRTKDEAIEVAKKMLEVLQ